MERKELEAKRDELIAYNQLLGREIDERRNKRRDLNAAVAKLNAELLLRAKLGGDPEVMHAAAAGGVVEVSGAEVLKQMAAKAATKQ